MLMGAIANSLDQVVNILYDQANSAYYIQHKGKYIGLVAYLVVLASG